MVNFLSYSLSAVQRIYADERHHQGLTAIFVFTFQLVRSVLKTVLEKTVSKTHVISS